MPKAKASTSTEPQTVEPGPSTRVRDRTEDSDLPTSRSLSEDQLHEYKEAFNEFDENGDGTISADELAIVIRSLGYDLSDDNIRQLMRDVDLDENGVVDFDEFVHLMQNHVRPMNSEELIFEAFQYIGGDGSGTINLEALREKTKELGLNFTDEELQDMIAEAEPDKDGKISYQGLIQFMSGGNETLWDAYKKRQIREEIRKEEEEEQRRQREREEELANEMNERVPDIEEIASQFDRSTYDEFSRQTAGRRLIKKPGKKVAMSKTRMQYLKRKAEAQGLDLDEYIEVREFKEAEQSAMRRVASSKDLWLGSIHEDRHFDTTFKSNPPKAYKHVESRLHAPGHRQGKHTTPRDRIMDRDGKPKLVLQTAVVKDFDKQLKKIQQSREAKHSTKSNSNMFPMKPAVKRPMPKPEKMNVKALDGYLARKKQKDEYSANYNMWRTFFEKAVKQINEAKQKIDRIEIALKDAQGESKQKKESNYSKEFIKKKERQNLRPNVITPTLENSNASQTRVDVRKPIAERKPLRQSNLIYDGSNDSQKTRSDGFNGQKKNNGSYVKKFRESRGLSVHELSTDDVSVSTQDSKKSWKPPKKTIPVISKETLDYYL